MSILNSSRKEIEGKIKSNKKALQKNQIVKRPIQSINKYFNYNIYMHRFERLLNEDNLHYYIVCPSCQQKKK